MIQMPKSGDLLIAPPAIPDPRFSKAVLMVTHENPNGHYAIALNKPTNHTLKDILLDTGIECELNFPLFWGGPVNMSTVWMLHTNDWSIGHTLDINTQWSLTSHISMFAHLADGDIPEQFRMFLGYAAWGSGQLRAELRGLPPWNHSHSWLVAENPGAGWLFEQPVEEMWINTMELSSHQAIDEWL